VTRRDTVVCLALAAGALIVGSLLTRSWWTGEPGLAIGLRDAEICLAQGGCVATSHPAALLGGSFLVGTRLTYAAGWLAAAARALLAWAQARRPARAVAFVAGPASLAAGALTIATLVSFPGNDALPMPAEVAVGASAYAMLGGAVLGATAALIAGLAPAAAPEPEPAAAADRATTGGPSPSLAATPTHGATYDERLARLRPARPILTSARAKRASARQKIHDVVVDKLAGLLRFVARECTVRDDALHVGGESEATTPRALPWSSIAGLIVRRLPLDAPFEGVLIVDVVPADLADSPTRLLPTTRIHYDAAPGPAPLTSHESLRRLAALILARSPRLTVDPATRAFIDDGALPTGFASAAAFLDYDRQYA
jgi:hypothetical protein